MRRLRAGLVTPLPGGLGSRSAGIRTPPRGARWTGTGANASSQETRTRGLKSPANKPRLRKLVWVERREAPLRDRKRRGHASYTHLRAHETDSYLVCRLL